MKYFTGIILITLTFFSLQLGAAELKVGVLDLQRIMIESNEGKKVDESLKAKHSEMQKELDKQQQELVDMQKDIEKQSLMLSMDAKEDKQREFEKKKRELAYLAQDMNEKMNKFRTEVQNELLKLIVGVVEKIAENKKFDMITERRTLLYYSKDLDITSEVIEELNKVKP